MLYLYVIVFLFLLLCYTEIALLVENIKKYRMNSTFRVISILFHFKSQSLEKQPGSETSRTLRPSIKMNLSN